MFDGNMPLDISMPDLVYFISLCICISLGSYYKGLTDPETKRNYGTGLGILITYLICGNHIYHSVLMVWGNIIIIKCCDKRYVHQLSLVYTWIYLSYMNYTIVFEGVPYEMWIHQAIALRVVGLAFEIYLIEKSKGETPRKTSTTNLDTDSLTLDISAIEIITYAYFFIGLHRGPYYRWKTFQDHFRVPYGSLGDCRIITEQKLKKALVCITLYIILRTNFPIETYYNDDFYQTYGTDSRYLFNIPQLAMFCLQYQVVLMLCTSVCTETGFGIYPALSKPIPGHGPTTTTSKLKLSDEADKLLQQEYNFGMLRCFENDKLVLGPRMRDTLRAWDMSTRYWFWMNAYKNIIKSKKEVRSLLSFLTWSIWVGASLQQFIIALTLWLHIQLEVEYSEIYEQDLAMKTPWDIGLSIMRLFCLIYLTPCFVLRDNTILLKYYNSIFWVYHLLLLILIIVAVLIYHSKKKGMSMAASPGTTATPGTTAAPTSTSTTAIAAIREKQQQ